MGTCTTVAAETSCVITGLTNGLNYKVAVTATNTAGTSAPSTPSSGTITPAPYTAAASPATPPDRGRGDSCERRSGCRLVATDG